MALRRAAVWLGLAEHSEPYDVHVPGELYDGEDGQDSTEDERAGPGQQIATVRPETFQDAVTIGEYFRHDVPVIINLHDMDLPDAKRIVDFACGLIFGRRGSIERISARVYLLLPPGYGIVAGQGSLNGEGFFNQA
ncbi:MAG: cell division protein SepF [Gemmatimonadota bacterium]